MIMCQEPKTLFYQSRRLTILTVGMFKSHGGSEATKIWLAQVRHIMHGHQENFQPMFSKKVSEAIKGQIREAPTQENLLGAKFTIRGCYMSINWRTVLGPQSGENHGIRDKSS